MEWFLYDNGPRHEGVTVLSGETGITGTKGDIIKFWLIKKKKLPLDIDPPPFWHLTLFEILVIPQ